jgi:Flp pilus assembly protein TadB
MLIETVKQAKRIIIAVVGFTLVLLGFVLFFTPGPGFAVVLLGLTALGAEFVWARRLLKRLKRAGKDVAHTILNTLHVTPQQPHDIPHPPAEPQGHPPD